MTEREGVEALIGRTALFGGLSGETLAACAAKFHELRYAKGEMLFARGDPGDRLFVVREGQVRIAIGTEDGRELSFQIVRPGELFGEIAVLDGRSRSAEAVALTPALCIALERRDFHRLREAHPALTEAIIAFLCRRVRDVSNRLESLALYSLEARVARFLLAALGDRIEPNRARAPVELQFSQTELALLLGSSRQKLNAALGSLEAAGAIKRTSDRLFCDRALLVRLAGGESV